MTQQLYNQHLMWRAAFGPAAGQLEQLKSLSSKQLFTSLREKSAPKPLFLDTADAYLKEMREGADGTQMAKKLLDKGERKNFQQKHNQSIRDLNLAWLRQMVSSEGQLREKLALFWHGHFAVREKNIFFHQDLLHIIRSNALESFRDLLHAVSKSAAMLNFLNANQNRKGHPNENFAREVMELFTLGRGHYTENDIKEAARAFTGWGANFRGQFVFRSFQHDTGSKTFLGKTGNLTGEEVLDRLLEQQQTARFITQKIYRYFVNDTPDSQKVEWLAKRFYQSDYNISALMQDIFTADWFYDAANRGTRIKSPVELLVGMRRMLPMAMGNEDVLLLLQRVLGQLLFYPPNVAGWPGGKSWIDSSSLMLRLRLPLLFGDNDEWNVRPKADDDNGGMDRMEGEDMMAAVRQKGDRGMGRLGKPLQVDIDWTAHLKDFAAVPREQLVPALAGTLLQTGSANAELIKSFADSTARDTFIKSATLRLMGLPEYQLC
ncbi:DUF1800 domain-containing protein [Paraflavisolibacter sp. H34]|uniref:DUF1800 domain-containing protein n=1 Tax=Huijunlia imazamoxiresistens TaxID=3127457 RepID=UPI0030194D2C